MQQYDRSDAVAGDGAPLRAYEPFVVTVTFPGFGASRAQMAKYCGRDGVVVLRNARSEAGVGQRCAHGGAKKRRNPEDAGGKKHPDEVVRRTEALIGPEGASQILYHSVCRVAPLLLLNVFPSPEVRELVTSTESWNPLHWLTMLKSRAAAWYFQLSGVPTSYMLLSDVNLGGWEDQACCLREIEKAVQLLKSEAEAGGACEREQRRARRRLVLFGCSRGATTMLLTALRLQPELAQHVGLVLVEAPFDSLENVLRDSSWIPSIAMALMRRVGKYDGDSGAYKMPDTTALSCPVAFVTSAADTRVPPKCTMRVISALREQHPHLELKHLHLEHSSHASMPIGHPKDRAAYEAFVRELYEQVRVACAENAR